MSATSPPPRARFSPTPIEETVKESSKDKPLNPLPSQNVVSESKSQAPAPVDPRAPRRRFAPQLIEESKRFKRSSTPGPATLPTDKTDITPGTNHIYVDRKKKYMRPIPVPVAPTPENSYQPELDPIESSESDENPDGSSEDSILRMQMARTRESCDERFSGYLLALAAKAAEKQLMEQALAAFPNESAYEIVEHFYDREIDTASEEDSVEGVGMLVEDIHMQQLRSDATEVGWAAKEMQQHQENLNRLREEDTNKRVAEEATAPTFHDPFWTNGMTDKIRPSGTPQDKQKEAELVRMRNAASPPMLGVPDAPSKSSERSKGGIQMVSGLDARLRAEVKRSKAEDMLLDEFDDTFVTQVYNYLSLGYPSLARQYDEELARISQIPEEELRIDDKKQNVKGHIGLVAVDGHVEEKDGKRINGERSEGGYGARWKALRLYILEWARQHPSMSNGASSPSAWV
ncbi:hypothetical protein DID88_008689 [Monilinia fructigena]|uniref:Uncharacterized protein n=1 Tax=Monilinia fructigena TaxID=38457 RepID=A0A395J626_9HELO|nr:hypothetical protein DID88_008689 [Monilinia fructigena]